LGVRISRLLWRNPVRAAKGPPCNCDACFENPGLTCSYTGDDVTVQAVYVANAYRGNLILCPGGANGQIGGLLHQLRPPQHYSHMGIMLADHDLVRHCTAEPARLTAEEYYSGHILGVSAPADGLDIDHVQYGWPGTITQSAEQIFFADRYGDSLTPPGLSGPYHGSDLVDKDSPSGKAYRIAAMSFEGEFDNGTWVPALVVKPCPLLETREVMAALDRVADEARKIHAHYRFYSYTNSAIAEDLNYLGPAAEVLEAEPDWESTTLKWTDWTDPTKVKWQPVPATVPGVCSSFVWQAVRNANAAAKAATPPLAQVVLDWAETHDQALGEAPGGCRRAVAPDWSADVLDTLDGLYLYGEDERKGAGKWLNDALSEQVFGSLKGSLAAKGGVEKIVADAIDDVGRGAFIASAGVGAAAVAALLSSVSGPVGVVIGGLSAVFIEQLIELLYDMPDDIANQICNSFAFDCHRGFPGDTHCVDAAGNEIRDIDSTNWADAPGSGRAVSPDNIHMFWDAPGPSERGGPLRGLYGFNAEVQLVVAAIRRPRCELVPSTGTATIHGSVLQNKQRVAGAMVRVNCQKTVSTLDPGYSFTVRSDGRYKVVARYEDPQTGITYCGEATTGIVQPGDTIELDIQLAEPPACLRNIIVEGTIRVDDVYLTGADHDQNQFRKTLYVQYGVPWFDESNGQWQCDPDDPGGTARQNDIAEVGASVGDTDAHLRIEVAASADLKVKVSVTGKLEDLSHTEEVTIDPGATETVAEFDLDTGGPFNDRAYFRALSITNAATKAI